MTLLERERLARQQHQVHAAEQLRGGIELRVAPPVVATAVPAAGGGEVDEGEGPARRRCRARRSSTDRARSGRGPAVAGGRARRIPARRRRARTRGTGVRWPPRLAKTPPTSRYRAGLSRGPSGWVTTTLGTNAASASASSRRFSSTLTMTWVGSSARMRSRRGVLVPPTRGTFATPSRGWMQNGVRPTTRPPAPRSKRSSVMLGTRETIRASPEAGVCVVPAASHSSGFGLGRRRPASSGGSVTSPPTSGSTSPTPAPAGPCDVFRGSRATPNPVPVGAGYRSPPGVSRRRCRTPATAPSPPGCRSPARGRCRGSADAPMRCPRDPPPP